MPTVAYVVNSMFVMTDESAFAGSVKVLYVPIERSIYIDFLLDFETSDFLTQGH